MAITQVNVSTPANEILFTDTAMGAVADAIKASSAVVNYLIIDNTANAAAASYVKLYNLAAGSVIVGTTVPDEVIYVPANQIITVPYFTKAVLGKTFNVALAAACLTTGGTAGTTPPVSSVIVTVSYI
jgi:hypothetical protein